MNAYNFASKNEFHLLKKKKTLWAIGIIIIIQFAIFKYFYPHVSYIWGDSFSYIDAADQNLSINTYLTGYSKFLRLFSVLTKSDFALALCQYLFIEITALFLLFTIFENYRAGKITQIVLIIIMTVNPLFLHLANLVSSDGMFVGLSFLWFSTLLWIIQHSTSKLIILHTIILFISFTFRYNALIYPVISLSVICFTKMPLRKKALSICVCFLPIALYVLSTSYQYKKLTGHWQYSPFSGWQLANNAMYSFRYVDSIDRKPVPVRFKELHRMVCEYFDSTRNASLHPIELFEASTYYMWSPGLTLMKYKQKKFEKDTTIAELQQWATMGPLYKEYGIYIIKQYPMQFFKHFIWPNSKKYFALPIEFLGSYNSDRDSVTEQARIWFGYKTRKVSVNTKTKEVKILGSYPIISGIVNAVLLCTLICFAMLGGMKGTSFVNRMIVLGGIIWLVNAIFTITVSSAALRFQSFPLFLTVVLSITIVDWMIQLMLSHKKDLINPTIGNRQIYPEMSGIGAS